MRDVLSVILGGGAGTRLYPLTKMRAKPAVPLAGKYRLIDIPISNCLNSGINQIYVLTQFNSASLHRHIYQTYKFDNFSGGWVQILAAEQTPSSQAWYQGTADAVRKQLPRILVYRPRDVLILSGDQLYRMDFAHMLAFHREHDADATIAVKPVGPSEAPRYGILKINTTGQVVDFYEKPAPECLGGLESDVDRERPYLASMGIYIFRTPVLAELLTRSDDPDFGHDIIPQAIHQNRVFAYSFDGYWEDIGTVRAFYETNLALARPNAPFDFFDPMYPIYTRPRFLPGSQVVDCNLDQVLLADGCKLYRSTVRESVVGLRSIIREETEIVRTVILGADFYETLEELAANQRQGRPDVGIGSGCSIEGAIIDKNVRIGEHVVIRPFPPGTHIDKETYVVRDGIVVIPKNTEIPAGTIIAP